MTTDEQIDGLVVTCEFEAEEAYSRICKSCGQNKGTRIHTIRADIKKLLLEARLDELEVIKEASGTGNGISHWFKDGDVKHNNRWYETRQWTMYRIAQLTKEAESLDPSV